MIKEIRIRNFAIIENLAVNFEKGLNVLTGETGAENTWERAGLGLSFFVVVDSGRDPR